MLSSVVSRRVRHDLANLLTEQQEVIKENQTGPFIVNVLGISQSGEE